MRVWLPLLIAAALAVPVQAGTADDPEVTDPTGDDTLGTQTDASNQMDIEYIFVQEEGTCGADHLYFEMKLANLLEDDQSSGPGASKEVTFALRGEEHVLVGEALMPAFTLDGEDIEGGIDNTLEIYFWCVPADMVGGLAAGDVVDGIWGRSVHGSGEETDRAPDEGTGRAYVIGQDEDDVTGELILPGNQSVELVNGTGDLSFDIQNNASEEDNVVVAANVTAGWNVTVSPDNHTLAPGENGTFTIGISGNGTGPVIIGVASDLGFRGSFSINVTHLPGAGFSHIHPGGNMTEGDGNETAGGGKDSPSPVWLVPLALLVVVAWRRR